MRLITLPENETCDVVFLTNTVDLETFYMTQKAIDSLRESEPKIEFNVIVVESNQDPHRLVPGEDHNYSANLTIHTKGEFSYNKALNLAFEHLKSDWVYVSNNDVLFMPNWYSIMRFYMDAFNLDSASPRCPVRQVGPKEEAQREILSFPEYAVIPGYRTVITFCGWGWLMKREVLEQLRPFPEDLTFWFQDDHMVLSLQKLNKKHGLVTSSHVIHFGQKSYKHIPQDKIHSMTLGLYEKFIAKWQ